MLKKMMMNNNIVSLIFNIFLLSFLGLAEAGQESIQLVKLYTISSPEIPQAMSHSGLAISLPDRDLNGVSSSVLKAETWLRTNVLSHYPSTQITTILVGDTLLCPKTHQSQDPTKLSLTLPSLRNIHHSLTRWGLEAQIKLSVSLSSPSCLTNHPQFPTLFNPILEFLRTKNSTLSIELSTLPHETKLGLFHGFRNINLILTNPKRKLTSFNFPTRPNPLPKTSDPPLHSSVGFSVPSTIAKHPQPPQAQMASPPENGITLSPQPLSEPTSPPPYPYVPTLPPCYSPGPSPMASYGHHHHHNHPTGAPMPAVAHHGLWCVAKPSVPADTLQAAMDYACGEGEADCGEIAPSGSCYSPDTVVAHASYAFNSYWQKHKRSGGTCSFGGTAMLINNDPSFLHCRFILS